MLMGMKVVIFDVEHGASAFIRTPTNYGVLIDCGSTGRFSPALYLVEKELPTIVPWNGRVLTKLIVTHPHDDHIGDVGTIKEKCPPALLLRQKYDWEEVKTAEADYDNLDVYRDWQNTYNAVPVVWPEWGMTIESFWLTVEEAKAIDEGKYVNNSSIVTVATFKGTKFQEKFVFGGDMETAGWDALLRLRPRFKEAVKGAYFNITSHHGHESGFSEALYAAMGKPIMNIVSIHNNDDHIDPRYCQEAYAIGRKLPDGSTRRQMTTRRDGTITISVNDEGKYWIETQCLLDNKFEKAANDLSWIFEATGSRR
jgi:beta-lactamase superfamily II metal-dependent hydrolase